jgi:hypothetical protein
MRRYTSTDAIPSSALYAWQLLGNSVYHNNPYGAGTLMLGRPGLGGQQIVSGII